MIICTSMIDCFSAVVRRMPKNMIDCKLFRIRGQPDYPYKNYGVLLYHKQNIGKLINDFQIIH